MKIKFNSQWKIRLKIGEFSVFSIAWSFDQFRWGAGATETILPKFVALIILNFEISFEWVEKEKK